MGEINLEEWTLSGAGGTAESYYNKKDETVTIGEKIKVPIKTIDKSNIELVKKLIKAGSDVNYTNYTNSGKCPTYTTTLYVSTTF